jgi:hypothetical protein
MQTVAVTYWNTIVSPLYDASCWLMIARAGNQAILVNIRDLSLYQRAELCATEGVGVLICGAISGVAQTILEDRGIRVVPWIRGSVDELIDAFQRGVELGEFYAMPGRGRKRRARQRCRRSRPGPWRC